MAAYVSRPAHEISHSDTHSDSVRSSWSSTSGLPQSNPRPRSLPHIKDIQATAIPDVQQDDSLKSLLQRAEAYIQSSQRAIDFRRPDVAYKDYLRGSEIVVHYIPRHRDYGFTWDNVPGWKDKYRNLQHIVRDMERQIADQKAQIQDDNVRSGVRPNSISSPIAQKRYDTGFGMSYTRGSGPASQQHNGSQQRAELGLPDSLQAGRQRPSVRPKPENLVSNANGEPVNDLSHRFARLRTPPNGAAIGPELTSKRHCHITNVTVTTEQWIPPN